MEMYMGWTAGRKRTLEWSIKFTIKSTLTQLFLLIFNICGIVWNFWWAFTSTGASNISLIGYGIGMGAFLSNALWTLAIVFKGWSEIRSEKAELKYLTELEIKEEMHEDRKMYKDAHNIFETTLAQYQDEIDRLKKDAEAFRKLGRSKKTSSKSPASLNPDIQPSPTQTSP